MHGSKCQQISLFTCKDCKDEDYIHVNTVYGIDNE